MIRVFLNIIAFVTIAIFSISTLSAQYKYPAYPDSVMKKIESENKTLENQVEAIEEYLEHIYHLNAINYKKEYFLPFLLDYEKKVFDLGNDLHIGKFYLNKGMYYYNLQRNDSALANYFKALNIFEKISYYPGIIHCSIFIGIVNHPAYYSLIISAKSREEYFRLAFYVSAKTDDLFAKAAANWSMGELMIYKKNLDSAAYFINNAFLYLDKLPPSKAHLKSFGLMLVVLLSNNSIELSKKVNTKKYLDKALETIEIIERNKITDLFSKDFQLSELYYRRYNMDSTAYYARRALDNESKLGKELLTNYIRFSSYSVLCEYEKSKGNYKESLEYLELYLKSMNDRFRDDPRVTTLELEKKLEKERYLQEQKLQSQRQVFILIISGILIVAVFVVSLFFYKRYKDRQRVSSELEKLNVTKDKLFSIVSHDLRNPVASLKQMLDIITIRYDKLNDESKYKYINLLSESSNRLYFLLDNLLSWSRLNLGQIKCVREETDVNAIISNELELLEKSIEDKNLKIEIIELESATENIDENIFRIIFRNLMTNAIKFSPHSERILIALEKQPDKLKLIVKDHGSGIEDETIDSIKNRTLVVAKSGTANERGNGIGLSIVSDLAELHGGAMEIEGEAAGGTTISIIFACSS